MKHREPTTKEEIPATSWSTLESFARGRIQSWLQMMLEEEVTELLGREHYARRDEVDASSGYRNGYGKPRRLSMTCGTITVQRPRVRDLEERFESKTHEKSVKVIGVKVIDISPCGQWPRTHRAVHPEPQPRTAGHIEGAHGVRAREQGHRAGGTNQLCRC